MPKFVSSTGDADSFLGAALARLASTFEVNPGFTFFEGGNTPNAFANPDTLLESVSGMVTMGTHLFNRMIRVNDGGVSLLMVCAHEFGHIHQRHSEYLQEFLMLDDTNKPIELHADYLAGYYLARRRDEHPDLDLRRVGDEVYKTCDFEFGDKQHHGTPDERFDALTAGYRFGLVGSPNITQVAG